MDDVEFSMSIQKAYDLGNPPGITDLTKKSDSDVSILGESSTSREPSVIDQSLDYAIALSLQEQSDKEENPNDLGRLLRNADQIKQKDSGKNLVMGSNRLEEIDENLDYAIALSLQEHCEEKTNSSSKPEHTKATPRKTGPTEMKSSEMKLPESSTLSVEIDESLDYAIALSLQEHCEEKTDSSSKPEHTKATPRKTGPTEMKSSEMKLPESSTLSMEIDESLDYAMAISLQQQQPVHEDGWYLASSHKQKSVSVSEWDPKRITDGSWELEDPTPNIHELFVKFDAMFFKSTLTNAGVAVSWSNKMTLCAGLCCYEGRGGLCSIRLSEPLLKLRPRKDLVETLLHEMIHALLFVTANNKDRESHGPEFQKHMHRINKETGANITIYHSFGNEVNLYRQHWWKCNGPCQKRPPFFGMVKRAMNRAPSPHDTWWNEHAASCGGTFVKVKEPEDYSRKKDKRKEKEEPVGKGSKNIVDMFKKATDEPSSQSEQSKTDSKRRYIVNGRIVVNNDADSSTRSRDSPAGPSDSPHPLSQQEYQDMRSKMLEAATKRLDTNKKRRSVKRLNANPDTSIEPLKKKSLASIGQDVVVINDEEPSSDCSSTVSYRSNVSIELCNSPSDDKRECPVCGRRNIPYQVINTHIEYCLEEMELEEN